MVRSFASGRQYRRTAGATEHCSCARRRRLALLGSSVRMLSKPGFLASRPEASGPRVGRAGIARWYSQKRISWCCFMIRAERIYSLENNGQNDPDATSDACRTDCSMQKARSSRSLTCAKLPSSKSTALRSATPFPAMAQTLVLFHELGGSLDSWNGLVPLPENLKVLRADMRGAGMSEKSVRHARYWLCLG